MPRNDRNVRVAVVGSGIAGLTTALRLSERGYEVTVYEKDLTLGGNLGSQLSHGVYHDVYPHMFCDWYVNFWKLFESDLGLDRDANFEARAGVKLLRKGGEYHDLKNPTTIRSIVGNLRSGVLSLPDMFLYGFSMLDLVSQPFYKHELLSRYSVNGFLHSRPYVSEATARLHDLVLMEIWSVHGDLTSAGSYKNFVKHTFAFQEATLFAWMLKGSLYERVIRPFEQKLEKLGCRIEMGTPVKGIRLEEDDVELRFEQGEPARYDYVVVAVPANALVDIICDGDPGGRIIDRLPHLSEVRRLRYEPIAVANVYFNRKLQGIPSDHVGLSGSGYDLTFLDISQLWTDDRNMEDRTALVLAASDCYALPPEASERAGFLMIERFHEYLPIFEPGKKWGDPNSDIDWDKSFFQPNIDHKLFVNQVGCAEWRPQTNYDAVPNVFFAGDSCPTDVDMATVEAAVLSGLNAASLIWEKSPKGDPIEILRSDVHDDATLLAFKLAFMPFAYAAKWWSLAVEATPHLAKGEFYRGAIVPAQETLSLPYKYVGDWWRTAASFWDEAIFGPWSRKTRPRRFVRRPAREGRPPH